MGGFYDHSSKKSLSQGEADIFPHCVSAKAYLITLLFSPIHVAKLVEICACKVVPVLCNPPKRSALKALNPGTESHQARPYKKSARHFIKCLMKRAIVLLQKCRAECSKRSFDFQIFIKHDVCSIFKSLSC